MNQTGKKDFPIKDNTPNPERCFICSHMPENTTEYHRHLLESHGIRVKGLTGIGANKPINYGMYKKFIEYNCPSCPEKFIDINLFKKHKLNCYQALKDTYNYCPICKKCFGKTIDYGHISKCKLHCQLCPFITSHIDALNHHLLKEHNLLAKPVDEPDFYQALNGTPYKLERIIDVNSWPPEFKKRTCFKCLQCFSTKAEARQHVEDCI